MMKVQNRNGAKGGREGSVVRVCVGGHGGGQGGSKDFRNCQPSGPDMQALQGGSKWEVGLGNRMESDPLEHRAMGLCGGRR